MTEEVLSYTSVVITLGSETQKMEHELWTKSKGFHFVHKKFL